MNNRALAKQYSSARAGLRVAAPRLEAYSWRRRLMSGAAAVAIVAGAAFLATRPALAQHGYMAAAGAWTFYNEAKKYLMSGDIDLNSSSFRMTLHTSASNAATATLSVAGSVTGEIADGNGYSTSGKALANVTWTAGASASEFRFDCDDLIWTASGGSIANVKFAVIWITGASAGARKLLCRSQLSTSQFTITTGNTLTIAPSANGIFELN